VAGANVAAETCAPSTGRCATGRLTGRPGGDRAVNMPGDATNLSTEERAAWIEQVKGMNAGKHPRAVVAQPARKTPWPNWRPT
jgi:hypothetical protein